MTSPGLHLWEADHPYYMTEGCFYAPPGNCHAEFESFDSFLAEMGDASENLNLLFRFDWLLPDPEDDSSSEQLWIFFVLQRKASLFSCVIDVTAADEPAVLRYLTPKARHIARLWEPIWQGHGA